jgi:transposase
MKSNELEQFVVLTATELSFASMWNSSGETVPNPRYLRKSEKALKLLQRRVSREKERF